MEREELLSMGLGEEAADKILEESSRMREEYEERIAAIKKDNEIELLLRDSGARNITAVKALITGDTDAKEQIERLKKAEDTRFLFETKRSFEPRRSGERLPDSTKNDYEARLFEARKSGNTVEAIRIKQQAASEGIMLI